MSAAFDLALATGLTLVTRVTVYDTQGNAYSVDVDSGSVDVDATAAIRRTCKNIVISDLTLVPTTTNALLSPLGNEIQLERGIQYPDGSTELYSLGVFGIGDVDVTETTDAISLVISQGYDRAKAVADNVWDAPYQVTNPDPAGAIQAIILDRYPGAQFNFAPTTGLVLPPLLYGTSDQDNDPWKAATDIATSAAMQLFLDPDGVFTLTPIPDPATQTAQWFVGDGQVLRLLGINAKLTASRSYNRVVAVCNSSILAAPLRSVAALVTSAPTRTFFYATSAATTQAQLDGIAQALLHAYSGAYLDVGFTVIPDPRVDVGTVGLLTRPSVGVDGSYVLEKFTIGLAPADQMQATVRGAYAL